jgi:hypothetical protein
MSSSKNRLRATVSTAARWPWRRPADRPRCVTPRPKRPRRSPAPLLDRHDLRDSACPAHGPGLHIDDLSRVDAERQEEIPGEHPQKVLSTVRHGTVIRAPRYLGARVNSTGSRPITRNASISWSPSSCGLQPRSPMPIGRSRRPPL